MNIKKIITLYSGLYSLIVIFLLSFYSLGISTSFVVPTFGQIGTIAGESIGESSITQVGPNEIVVKDNGFLIVTTGVNDQTTRDIDDKFTVDDIVIEITGVAANPQIFPATTQPQTVKLQPGGIYGTTIFLKVTSADETLTQLVDLGKINDIIKDQGLDDGQLPLLLLQLNGQVTDECKGQSRTAVTDSCNVFITFFDEYLDVIEDFVNFDINGIGGIGGTGADTEEQLESASGGVISTSISSGQLPVDVCRLGPTAPAGTNPLQQAFRPIGATYYFDGVIDISKVKEIADDSDSFVEPSYPSKVLQQLIFEILFDNHNPNLAVPATTVTADSIKLTPANSIFQARVYGDQEPYNHEKAPFTIDKIYTECKWISIASAQTTYEGSKQSSADGTKIFALGQLDEAPPSSKTDVPSRLDRDPSMKLGSQDRGLISATNEATSGLLGSLGGGGTETNILNPPFVQCTNTFASGNQPNVLSDYKLVAGIDRDDLKGIHGTKDVSLRVTVDLIPTDQALITENNNELIKMNLVINPGEEKDKVDVIELGLITISTDCLSVAFSDDIVMDF
ncbi:MAG TPA: hypothetical protein VJ767_05805 [Nitrososphaeraceae archaeon]|nr:hypothetical protein [Nitrososphaeraceae archaeon]